MILPSRPCFRCGARGWCGHDGRVEPWDAARAIREANGRPLLLVEQFAAAWGWVR